MPCNQHHRNTRSFDDDSLGPPPSTLSRSFSEGYGAEVGEDAGVPASSSSSSMIAPSDQWQMWAQKSHEKKKERQRCFGSRYTSSIHDLVHDDYVDPMVSKHMRVDSASFCGSSEFRRRDSEDGEDCYQRKMAASSPSTALCAMRKLTSDFNRVRVS